MKIKAYKKWSIRQQVLGLVIIPLVAVTLFLTVYNINKDIDRELSTQQLQAEKLLLLAADAAQLALFAGDISSLENLSTAILQDIQISAVYFFDDNKKKVSSKKTKNYIHTEQESFIDGNNSIKGNYWYFMKEIRQSHESFNDNPEDSISPPQQESLGWVLIVINLQESQTYRDTILRNNLLIALLILGITIHLAIRFSRRIVIPISNITHAIERYSAEDFSHRVDEISTGELGVLEKGINSLAKRVGTSQLTLKDEVFKATSKWIKAANHLEEQNTQLAIAKDSADKANRSKDDFLARMSHELRTPLTGIIGFTRLLEKTNNPETQQDYTKMIFEASSILLTTINDILDFSKLQSKSFNLHNSRFNLERCLRDTISIHRASAIEKSIEINILMDFDVPTEILSDSDKLQTIINNILSNAIKFTKNGDIIIFVSLENQQDNETELSISIKDSGIGIRSEDIHYLFNPFFQCDETTTRKYEGTGLGLAIAKDFVELMDGKISVDSTPNEGTEIEFTFKCKAFPSATSHLIPSSSCHIAIYDNNPWTRRSWRNQLLKYTDKVSVPATFIQLLATLNSNKDIDALILGFNSYDTHLENIIDNIQKIRTSFNGNIILATADDGSIQLNTLHSQFASLNIISKPVSNNDLLSVINSVTQPFNEHLKSSVNLNLNLPDQPHENDTLLQESQILIVEDNDFIRKLLVIFFKNLGANVHSVSKGQDALQYCEKYHFTLFVFDLHMPDFDGLQLTSIIRASNTYNSTTPIIILTADLLFKLSPSNIELGVSAICYKPIDEDDLMNKALLLSEKPSPPTSQKLRPLISASPVQIKEEISRLLELIQQNLTNDKLTKLEDPTHQLMGMVGMLGINRLYDLALRLNKSAQQQSFDKANNDFQEILLLWKTIDK